LDYRAAIAVPATWQALEVMLQLVLLEEHKNTGRINYDLRVEVIQLKMDLL
jgi:hypothetical protein